MTHFFTFGYDDPLPEPEAPALSQPLEHAQPPLELAQEPVRPPAPKLKKSPTKTLERAPTKTLEPDPEPYKKATRAELAAIVRRMAAEQDPKIFWSKLQHEFITQKAIWDSVSLSMGARHQGKVTMLWSKMELAMMKSDQDQENAALALESALEKSQEGEADGVPAGSLLNSSTTALAKGVLRSIKINRHLEELAAALEAAARGARMERQEIQALVTSCEFTDQELLSSVIGALLRVENMVAV